MQTEAHTKTHIEMHNKRYIHTHIRTCNIVHTKYSVSNRSIHALEILCASARTCRWKTQTTLERNFNFIYRQYHINNDLWSSVHSVYNPLPTSTNALKVFPANIGKFKEYIMETTENIMYALTMIRASVGTLIRHIQKATISFQHQWYHVNSITIFGTTVHIVQHTAYRSI